MSSAISRFRVFPNSQFHNYTIIYVTFTLIITQMMMILLLLFETPFRNPLLVRLDEWKRGRSQLTVKSVLSAVFVVIMYNIYRVCIRNRSVDSADHVILAYRMFEAYIMDTLVTMCEFCFQLHKLQVLYFSLILLIAINSLHQCMKEFVMVTETIQAAKKQNRAYKHCIKKTEDEAKVVRKDISRLKTKITNLELDYSIKEQAVQLKRADSSALKTKLEGLFEEYDRLLAYNKDLKDQLQCANERSSGLVAKRSIFFSWDRWGL
ncbi:hypothetical protein R6Q57_028767 [Mikania cordata]